jgi:hypothetical protein
MGSSPGLPKSPESSFRDTAATCVGLADFVTGVSQLDSTDRVDAADGLAAGAEGDAALGVASGVGISCSGATMGSGATEATGAGAGATGGAGTVGAGRGGGVGVRVGVGVADGEPVGLPVPGLVGGVFWPPGRSPQTAPQPGPVSPLSACAGAAAAKPTVNASTVIDTARPRGTEEDRIMVTFADGARHPSAAN